MAFQDHLPRLDAEIDERLGDDVNYSTDGVTFTPLKGFVIKANEAEDRTGLMELDPLNTRDRLKISKLIVLEPSKAHRILTPILGPGEWSPVNWTDAEKGRYWLIDVARV